jgi:hypothetical protein
MLYAVITDYASGVTIGYKPTDHDLIYGRMMDITESDHEISSDAASWCELASEGETYEFHEGKIEIIED